MRKTTRGAMLLAGCLTMTAQGRVVIPQVLTAFVEREPYLAEVEKHPDLHLLKKIEDPRTLHRLIIKGHIQSRAVTGLCAVYAGWWTYSDVNGQLSFPLEHTEAHLMVVITRRILPIKSHNDVVKGFFVPPGEPHAAYRLERHEKTVGKEQKMWWTIMCQDLPEKGILPADALVIFAKPQHIHLHEGVTHPTVVSHNLLLPKLFVPYNVNLSNDALYITAVNRYFAPVMRVIARTNDRYATIMVP